MSCISVDRYVPLPYDHSPKERPSQDAVDEGLRNLKQYWPEIAGGELADHTQPDRFTGKKRRRLVVIADAEYEPAWGSWRSASEFPQAFSRFRSAVNEAIRPLRVDHIEFESKPKR